MATKCKIFSFENEKEAEKEINEFLSKKGIEFKAATQSSESSSGTYLAIFYTET